MQNQVDSRILIRNAVEQARKVLEQIPHWAFKASLPLPGGPSKDGAYIRGEMLVIITELENLEFILKKRIESNAPIL